MSLKKTIKWTLICVPLAAILVAGIWLCHIRRPFTTPYSRLSPEVKLKRFLNGEDVVLNIAHRGLKELALPNTMSAIAHAYEMGCDGVEIDVVPCKTGQVIVHHDFTLKRTAQIDAHVLELPLERIKQIRLDPPKNIFKYVSDARIPTLRRVLREFGGKMIIFIEVKSEDEKTYGTEIKVAEMLREMGLENSCLVSSFAQRPIVALARDYPDVNSVVELYGLPQNYRKLWPETSYPYSISLRSGEITPEFVRWANKKFRGVSAFTPNEENDFRKLLACGVTLFQTNNPRLLAKILNEKQSPR